ncbi:MAG: glycosyltransferase family 1 protein [Chloroflexi bacterium]|nr:MAG: glycosyltransferase family 1 protein [Chloroflexota bacterium]
MNIAMLSYHTCPLATLGGKDTGGMNVYVAELTRHLGHLGVHVDVYTRSQNEHVPHVLHDLGYGNRVVHIPAGPEVPLPKPELAAHIPQFVSGIEEFAAKKGLQYDLIHSHYWMSGAAAELLQVKWKAPIVQMFHTLVMMKNRVARSPGEMEGSYRLEGEQRILKLADRIVAATLAEQAQLEFLYHADSGKVAVIPPGVDTSRFYPIPKDEAKAAIDLPVDAQMILFVGRIEPLKGVDTLMQALAYIQSTNNLDCCPHYLAIIGGDPEVSDQSLDQEMTRIKALSAELGLGDIVLFLGKRSQESLPYYYSAADVVVVPSHYESFGMVALEAMACGTPVVASQVGGLAFLVQDGVTGFVVPNGEPELLGQHLIEIILDPDLRARLGAQGAEIARGYSWEIIAARIMALYNDLLNTSPHPHVERRLSRLL